LAPTNRDDGFALVAAAPGGELGVVTMTVLRVSDLDRHSACWTLGV
jgi:hypothetical protein